MADNVTFDLQIRSRGRLAALIAESCPLGRQLSPNVTLSAMSTPRDRAIARLAGAQRTIVSGEQLLACGLGSDAITYRSATGRLTVVFRGVFSVVDGELPPLAREQAALLACGRVAFLSHQTAAFVWGLRTTRPGERGGVVGRDLRLRDGIRVHRIKAIDRREVRHHEGLWVSSPSRAVLEVAAAAPAELPGVIDAGLALRILDRRELERVLARNRPCRGAARLAAIVGDPDAMTLTRSKRERAFLRLMRQSGLPMPERTSSSVATRRTSCGAGSGSWLRSTATTTTPARPSLAVSNT